MPDNGSKSIIVFVLISAFVSTSILFGQEVLTLDEAVAQALAHNRLIASARLNVEKSADELKAAHTRYYPQFSVTVLASHLMTPVDFTFQRGAFGEYPGIGPIPAENTKITTPQQFTGLVIANVQQPLSQIYKIKLSTDLAKTASEAAKEAEREQRQSVVNQVKKLYYGIVQSQSAYTYTLEAVKLFHELDRITSDYVVQQVALKSDGLQVKAKLAKAEYDSIVASNDLSTRKEQLNELMGRDLRIDFQVNAVPDETPFEHDLVAAQQRALERNPEIQKASWQLKQADYDRRMKKAEYIPDVSFSINYLSPLNYEFVPTVIASYGFYFSWDVYDWGRKGHELDEKARTIKQAELAITETQNKVLVEINEQFRKVQESRKLILAARLAQDAAEEGLRISSNQYKEHSALFKDVAQAQTSLEETRDQYNQALLSFWAARADFEKSLGEDQ